MSDLPDFTNYSQVDLVQQTIAFLTNRPMYGEARNASGSNTITPNTGQTLVTILGKGKIYTGFVYVDTDHIASDDIIYMYVDNQPIFSRPWKTFIKYNLIKPNNFVAWLSCFDEANYIYMLNFMNDITFEEKLEVGYRNESSKDVDVYCNIIHSLLNI